MVVERLLWVVYFGFAGDLSGIWVFVMAPLVSGILAAIVYKFLDSKQA